MALKRLPSHEPRVCSGGRLTHLVRIPTGFRPKARGWTAQRAYPGEGTRDITNPNGVAPTRHNPVGVG